MLNFHAKTILKLFGFPGFCYIILVNKLFGPWFNCRIALKLTKDELEGLFLNKSHQPCQTIQQLFKCNKLERTTLKLRRSSVVVLLLFLKWRERSTLGVAIGRQGPPPQRSEQFIRGWRQGFAKRKKNYAQLTKSFFIRQRKTRSLSEQQQPLKEISNLS